MAIVTIGVVLAIGLFVLQQMGKTMGGISDTTNVGTILRCGTNSSGEAGTVGEGPLYTNCSAAYNATNTLITKLGTAPTWIGLLIVVVFASAILAYFYFKQ
jgi:hypothetical protein